MKPQLLRQAIDFLAHEQQPEGDFISFSSIQEVPHTPDKAYRSVFPNALLLDCLCSVPESPSLAAIKKKLVDFLLTQKSEHWSFNYWARTSSEAATMPYPDDLDDTACALAALVRANAFQVDAAALAKVVRLLTALEQKVGGPYRTWVVPKNAPQVWRDVDLVVNSNIAYFLSLQDISLPSLVALAENAMLMGDISSAYYPSFYPIAYFWSRWYRGAYHQKLVDMLLEKRQAGRWGDVLPTALATSALLRLGVKKREVREAVSFLEESASGGHWNAASLYPDPVYKGVLYYAGSAALTTGFCLEALSLASASSSFSRTVISLYAAPKNLKRELYATMKKHIQARFLKAGVYVKKGGAEIVDKVLAYDRKKFLALMPYYAAKALGVDDEALPSAVLLPAALMSFYGWLAYTVYDDFLDEEAEATWLPMANVALREVVAWGQALAPSSQSFQLLVGNVLDMMENANAWEVLYCRSVDPLIIPRYKGGVALANRSLGHSLGAIGLLVALGHDANSEVIERLTKFFSYYLHARQLHDDMHDWEDDLRAGQISSVAAYTLLRYQGIHGKLNRMPDFSVLREFFWQDVAPECSKQILDALEAADFFITSGNIFSQPEYLLQLTKPLRDVAEYGRQEQAQTAEFLRAYQA